MNRQTTAAVCFLALGTAPALGALRRRRANPPSNGTDQADAASDAPSAGPEADGDGGSSNAAAAARNAAETSAACAAIQPFYWEIGDEAAALVSGSVGGTKYTVSTQIPIASASKLTWGAYIVERFKADLTAVDMPRMTMRSGYTSFSNCVGALTVGGCLNIGTNGQHNAADDGFFTYGGGHFQEYAANLGLGLLTNASLAAEMQSKLGADINIKYEDPDLAGGINVTPGDYARLLRKIIDGTLALGRHLRRKRRLHAAVGVSAGPLQPGPGGLALLVRTLGRGRSVHRRPDVQQPGPLRLLSVDRFHEGPLWPRRPRRYDRPAVSGHRHGLLAVRPLRAHDPAGLRGSALTHGAHRSDTIRVLASPRANPVLRSYLWPEHANAVDLARASRSVTERGPKPPHCWMTRW